jgi:glycosyltransferase involved in cell wall biosynthesis
MYGTLQIHHPRYLVMPKIGMNWTPYSLFRALKRTLRDLLLSGRKYDLIDAHYFYPDGVAAVWLGRQFRIPVVVTARGSDLSLIPDFRIPRRMIRKAAEDADGLVAVCQALKGRLVELGSPAGRVTVLRNGVDLELFHPKERGLARATLGLKRRTLGSVGLLIERKGHHHVIRALTEMPETDLVIVGDGPERSSLMSLARELGVAERVKFLGAVVQERLTDIYSAIDALVLASSREGWANVLLESMACGTPVVASAVWGTPEVITGREAGVLMPSLDARGVVVAVAQLFAAYPTHEMTRRYAERFSWDATTNGQIRLFRQILADQPNKAP